MIKPFRPTPRTRPKPDELDLAVLTSLPKPDPNSRDQSRQDRLLAEVVQALLGIGI